MLDILFFLQLNSILIFSDDFPISENKLLVGEIWIIDMDDLLTTNTAGAAAPAGGSTEEVDECQDGTKKVTGDRVKYVSIHSHCPSLCHGAVEVNHCNRSADKSFYDKVDYSVRL